MEDNEGQGEKGSGGDGASGPPPPVYAEGALAHELDAPREAQSGAFGFLGRLTVNEWLTLLVGVGSLVVSYLTYRNATDTSDLKNAVTGLTNLVTEAHGQAAAMQIQATAMQAQLEQMVLAQRAWLLVHRLSIGTIQQFPVGSGVTAVARYEVTNIGRSPATAVFIRTALVLNHIDQFGLNTARSLCQPQPAEAELQLAQYSDTVLPGQSETIDGINDAALFSHTIEGLEAKSNADINSLEEEIRRQLEPNSKLRLRPRGNPSVISIEPVLVGCVTYRTNGGDILHKTGFAFEARNGILTIPIEIGRKGEVFGKPLQIYPSPVGNFAD